MLLTKTNQVRPIKLEGRTKTYEMRSTLYTANSALSIDPLKRMLRGMSDRIPPQSTVIDVGPPKRRRWRLWLVIALLIALFSFSRVVAVYLSALWFGSLGFADVYWYILKLKVGLFFLFAILTAILLQTTFWLFQKLFGAASFENRTIILNNQPFQFSPARFIRPLGWVIAAVVGLIYGLTLKDSWQKFALYLHRPPTGPCRSNLWQTARLLSVQFAGLRRD